MPDLDRPETALDVLDALRSSGAGGEAPDLLDPTCHFYDPRSGLFGDGVYHNCVAAVAALLEARRLRGDLWAEFAADDTRRNPDAIEFDAARTILASVSLSAGDPSITLESIVAAHAAAREAGGARAATEEAAAVLLLRRRVPSGRWSRQVPDGSVWDPAFFAGDRSLRSFTQASAAWALGVLAEQLCTSSSSMASSSPTRAAVLDAVLTVLGRVLDGLVSKYWDPAALGGKGVWKRTVAVDGASSGGADAGPASARAVDQAMALMALSQARRVFAGSGASDASLTSVASRASRYRSGPCLARVSWLADRTAETLAAAPATGGFGFGFGPDALPVCYYTLGAGDGQGDVDGAAPTCGRERVSWHEAWVLLSLACSGATAARLDACAAQIEAAHTREARAPLLAAGTTFPATSFTGDNFVFAAALDAGARRGAARCAPLAERVLSRCEEAFPRGSTRDGLVPVGDTHATVALWANTERALALALCASRRGPCGDHPAQGHDESSGARDPVYLDYNATTPLSLDAEGALARAGRAFGNASSAHSYGARAREIIDGAREDVARCLGARGADEIVFTSGGTEANNYAIRGAVEASVSRDPRRNVVVTTAVEHPAVEKVCADLEARGALAGDGTVVPVEIVRVPVGGDGIVDLRALRAAADPARTALVTVMHANNEVGCLNPIAQVAEIAAAAGALSHTDASQSVGKAHVSVAAMGVDLLTIAGHKLYACKGVGALYMRRGVEIVRQTHGAGHERGLRPGTENTTGIATLGTQCRAAVPGPAFDAALARVRATRDALLGFLTSACKLAGATAPVPNGPADPSCALPNTLSVAFPGAASHRVLARLSGTVAASAGSACDARARHVTVSRVLAAMGLSRDVALGTLRLSVGSLTTEDEIHFAADRIAEAVAWVASHPE